MDIFFILERADGEGYLIILDQRKLIGANVTNSYHNDLMSKLPCNPDFLNQLNVRTVFGLMSIKLQINIEPIPEDLFFISSRDTFLFHGTLVDHPGCSIAIDLNTAFKVSVEQVFKGTAKRRNELAELIIIERKKRRINGIDDFLKLVKSEELDDSALERIKF